MLVDTFANRLNKALKDAGLNQTQLAKKTKIDKSLISNYLAGNYKAKQNKLTLIADALDVEETWLMGFDVPKKNKKSKENLNNRTTANNLILLLEKNIDILTNDDKETIKFIIEKRKREKDKELDEE